jgi:cell cycle checkpoint control protein RAD9A
MNEPESLVAPSVPESQVVSHVTLPARTIKDMLEHFPVSQGGGGKESRNDPQVVWTFEDGDVHIRSFERSVNTGGE